MLPATSSRLDAIEATLADLLPRLAPAPPRRGRPEILPGALLWAGLLVCILRGATRQTALWRRLGEAGLWHYPTVPAEAVRVRLVRSGPPVLARLFADVTAALAAPLPPALELAPFAAGV